LPKTIHEGLPYAAGTRLTTILGRTRVSMKVLHSTVGHPSRVYGLQLDKIIIHSSIGYVFTADNTPIGWRTQFEDLISIAIPGRTRELISSNPMSGDRDHISCKRMLRSPDRQPIESLKHISNTLAGHGRDRDSSPDSYRTYQSLFITWSYFIGRTYRKSNTVREVVGVHELCIV